MRLALIVFLIFTSKVRAENVIEQVQISHLYIEPSISTGESSTGSFKPVLASVDLKSSFSSWLEVKASLATAPILGRPKWSDEPAESLSFSTLKGVAYTSFGEIFVGQTQIPWGFEGNLPRHKLWLPRSLFFETRQIPVFDLGAGFSSSYNDFYFTIVGHNGEGVGINKNDNRFFVTGQWGYDGPAKSKVGISLMTGRYIQSNVENRLRAGNVFFGFNVLGLGFQTEGNYFRNETSSSGTNALAWNANIQHPVFDFMDINIRYEQLISDMAKTDQVIARHYWGFEFHSQNGASRVFLHYIKNTEPEPSVANDEVLVSWRVMTLGLD